MMQLINDAIRLAVLALCSPKESSGGNVANHCQDQRTNMETPHFCQEPLIDCNLVDESGINVDAHPKGLNKPDSRRSSRKMENSRTGWKPVEKMF